MAGKITEQVLDEIRSRIDIADLIGAYVPLKHAGGSYKACCPFHHEKTPSFTVNVERQRYHCFGCGEDGDIFTFLMKHNGLTFVDAVQQLAEKAGVKLEMGKEDLRAPFRNRLYALMGELAEFYRRCLVMTKEAEGARRYLADRKLPDAVAERFGIGYAPRSPDDAILKWAAKRGFTVEELIAAGVLATSSRKGPNPYYDRFKGRLMFPIRDAKGRVVAFSGRILPGDPSKAKYVNSPETEVFVKGRILYALDKAAPKLVKHPRREAIICEGQIDVIRCHASGFETAVASQGTAFTQDQVDLLKRYADSVVLVFDGDGAGRKATFKTGALFLAVERPVRVARLPKGEDPDSLLREKGPEVFQELLDNAVSITAFQVEALRQEEPNPDTIDAVNRISRKVLEMLAGCPGAILRSHLLQEASELLHLPLSALEEDLTRVQEEVNSRATTRGSAAKPAKAAPPEPPDAPAAFPETFPEGEWVPADGEDELPSLEGVEPAAPRPDPPSRIEYLLCELMMECERDREVADLVRRYLPLDILEHPFARGFFAALFAAPPGDEGALPAYFATVDPVWHPLVSRLIANEQKMLSARESRPVDAAKDLVRAAWVAAAERQRGMLNSESTPENDANRFRLSCLIKAFKTEPWERVCNRFMPEGIG